ncbi:MAG: alkyl hydroperoxide reductase AhpD [Rhodothermaceae bacterium]|nr:MAG: alkyl hydroperoxide reductase AhpD [Rhodothermaceae bacterium]
METTTQQAQNVLDNVQQKYGFVPNLYREMTAHSPAVADVYLQANEAAEGISLTPRETQAVILAVSAYNDCHYCTKAHRTVGKMVGLPEDEIDAILGGDLPRDERLRHLVAATRLTLDKRGWLSDEDLETLASRGISRGQVYEIVALIGIKTISNYINHIAHTEVDPQFQ